MLVIALVTGLWSLADDGDPYHWDPETEIPAPIIFGNPTPEERAAADAARAGMVQMLAYWKARGLSNPPDLDRFIYISGDKALGMRELAQVFNSQIPDLTAYIDETEQALDQSALGALLTPDQKQQVLDYYLSLTLTGGMLPREGFVNKIRANEAFNGGTSSAPGDRLVKDNAFYANFLRINAKPLFKSRAELTPQNRAFLAQVEHERGNEAIAEETRERLHTEASNTIARLNNGGMSPREIRKAKKTLATLSQALKRVESTEKKGTRAERMASWVNLFLDSIHWNKLHKVFKVKAATNGSNIVILPRSRQDEGPNEVASIFDRSVVQHELGHHVNKFVGQEGLDRLMEEVMADYLAASALDDPKIGQFFASASKEIAHRIRQGQDLTEEDVELAEKLEKIGEKVALRDLSTPQSIDDLERSASSPNAYRGGDPLRWFLWSLRQDPRVDRAQFETALLKASEDMGTRPALYGIRTMMNIAANEALRMILKASIEYKKRNTLQKELTEEQNKEIKKEAQKLAKEELDTLEAKARQKRLKQQLTWGTGKRSPIVADYVIPEFLRSMYRQAARISEPLAEKVKEHATNVMNSDTFEVSTKQGKELVFAKNTLAFINPFARAIAWAKLNRLNSLRETYALAKAASHEHPDDESLKEKAERIKGQYIRSLEGLLEFERTGKVRRLIAPHPVMEMTKWGVKAGVLGLKAASMCASIVLKFVPRKKPMPAYAVETP